MKFGGQFGTTADSPSNSGEQQRGNYFNAADDNPNLQFIHICRRFNNSIECYSDCWYIHIYNKYKKKNMRKEITKKNDSSIISKWTFFCSSFQNLFRIFSSTHQHFFWQIMAHYGQKNKRNDCKIIWINCMSTFFVKSLLMKPALITQIQNNRSSI